MSNNSRQIIQAQCNEIRRLMEEHKSESEIIKELNVAESTFFNYKKRIQKEDSKLWDKIYMDSAKYRAVELIRLLDFTKNLCLKIVDKPNASDRDKMEAARTACEAAANIYKLVKEGPTFRLSIEPARIIPALQNNA